MKTKWADPNRDAVEGCTYFRKIWVGLVWSPSPQTLELPTLTGLKSRSNTALSPPFRWDSWSSRSGGRLRPGRDCVFVFFFGFVLRDVGPLSATAVHIPPPPIKSLSASLPGQQPGQKQTKAANQQPHRGSPVGSWCFRLLVFFRPPVDSAGWSSTWQSKPQLLGRCADKLHPSHQTMASSQQQPQYQLPAPWTVHEDQETGAPFFFNPQTGESLWEPPAGTSLLVGCPPLHREGEDRHGMLPSLFGRG